MLTQRAPLFAIAAVFGLGSAHCGGHTRRATTDGMGGASATGPTTGGDATGAGPASATSVGTGATSGMTSGVSVGTGGGSIGTGGAGGASGGCSTGLEGGTLTGRWLAIGTHIGKPSLELEIIVDAQRLEVKTVRGSFLAQKTGPSFAVTYSDLGATAPKRVAATQQVPGTVVFGAIPLDLSGSWSFRNMPNPGDVGADPYGCDATLSARSLSATCSSTRLPRWIVPYDPGTGSATGTKVADAPSIFGDLGGTWSVPLLNGGCTFRFEGSSFASSCGPKLGGMQITFCGSTASGTTTTGIEFSAQRS